MVRTRQLIGAAEVGAEKRLSTTKNPTNNAIVLDHHIFDSSEVWKKAESMQHPTLKLRINVDTTDYEHVGVKCPNVKPSHINAVTDTGAQSCLWGLQDFYNHGFKKSDLLPMRRTLIAANREEIEISGAVFIRLTGSDQKGVTYTAPVMIYISPSTEKFYLSRETLIQLGVISRSFPRVGRALGHALEHTAIEHDKHSCGRGLEGRGLPPRRPDSMPFPCTPENNHQFKLWVIERFEGSTFNKCPHQKLLGMTGPYLRYHMKPGADAESKPVHTPAVVPLHWEEKAKRIIKEDEMLGTLEKVPYGEPTVWCHRMVLVQKSDGSLRRTIDLSPLNRHCLRETHHVKPPFQQARGIPPHIWKSVTDAWNGYHSVPLHPDDRYLTTFITPWGRYRSTVATQGHVASGDGYTRRYDEIIADVERKTKCVDDTAMWDTSLEDHWWRMPDYLELCGRNGIVLNKEKFQFAQREINFAGLRITETAVKPLEKFLVSIRDFPTPAKLTDVRSWFGLVNQVSNYNQLSKMMLPFRPLLKAKTKFYWSKELDRAFILSKREIVKAIEKGVEIFDLNRRTCIRPDWSKTGIGFCCRRSIVTTSQHNLIVVKMGRKSYLQDQDS